MRLQAAVSISHTNDVCKIHDQGIPVKETSTWASGPKAPDMPSRPFQPSTGEGKLHLPASDITHSLREEASDSLPTQLRAL